MFSVAFLRIVTAISYFAKSHQVNDLSQGLFSNHLWAWGAWDLGIAAFAFFAGLSLLGGGGFGRVVGYIWAVLVIVQSFLIISITPWFAATMIRLAVLVIYGLGRRRAVLGSRTHETDVVDHPARRPRSRAGDPDRGAGHTKRASLPGSLVSSLCSSLTSLESSTKSLTSLDPKTASKSHYQSAVSTVQSDWNQVASDAKDVASASMSQLDSAWGDFSSAVRASRATLP